MTYQTGDKVRVGRSAGVDAEVIGKSKAYPWCWIVRLPSGRLVIAEGFRMTRAEPQAEQLPLFEMAA